MPGPRLVWIEGEPQLAADLLVSDRAASIDIPQQPDLCSVVDLLIDQHAQHTKRRPFHTELRRAHLVEGSIVERGQRARVRPLTLDQVGDRACGVAVA